MHLSGSSPRALSAAIALALISIICFALLPFVTVASSSSDEQRKTVLGSRPPRCINKCMSCKPCLPTLVVQGHRVEKATSSLEEDDEYYLLAWKCRCGNKLFKP